MMECEIAKNNNKNNSFPSTSSSSPPQSPPTPILISPLHPNDECYSCKRKGHWAPECPNKTPKKPASSIPFNNSIKNDSNSPVVRCPCGRGVCLILISKSEKNPGKVYYRCPVTKDQCKFFKWYDDLRSITDRSPMCPCGVGICSVNKVASPTSPKGERWYFACRIKKNHGACEFFRWADSEQNNTNQRNGCESKPCSSLLSRFNDLDKKEMSYEINLESSPAQRAENSPELPIVTACSDPVDMPNVDIATLAERTENSSYLPIVTVDSDEEDISNMEIVIQEAESLNPMTAKPLQVFQPMAQPQSPCLKESWRHISVMRNTIIQDAIYRSLGLHVYGWLGRLAFPPSQSLKDPPAVPIFVCIFPSFDPVTSPEDVNISVGDGPFQLPHRVSHAETNMPASETPRDDAQLSSLVTSELKKSSGTLQDINVSSRSVLKAFGQFLFDLFETMRPLDPEQMLKVAEKTFIKLQNLSIECPPFVEGVKKYIDTVSLLASIEGSIHEGPSSQELITRYQSEKVRFDNVSRLHTEAEAAYTTSNNQLQSLQQEISRVKGILVELEKQLVDCEAEMSRHKERADEVSEDVLESKANMEITSREMMKALELEKQRESVQDEAQVALETVRVWIEEL